ncbi:hypothetical protein HZY91_03815 [Facklamia sp. DSM 111018]|uniref:DUF4367 domain-containing protein n=1 Tax=Facklamia lactis TaxID=2749967 RepID=A0ABS0LPR7_9LACT|nr:hypothetical protein [Facklamia lactis]MBG9980216.1 hypothetical protein [Facklamia lactis]MBG9986019.1 hypothetical protein [Facklamia lactis]
MILSLPILKSSALEASYDWQAANEVFTKFNSKNKYFDRHSDAKEDYYQVFEVEEAIEKVQEKYEEIEVKKHDLLFKEKAFKGQSIELTQKSEQESLAEVVVIYYEDRLIYLAIAYFGGDLTEGDLLAKAWSANRSVEIFKRKDEVEDHSLEIVIQDSKNKKQITSHYPLVMSEVQPLMVNTLLSEWPVTIENNHQTFETLPTINEEIEEIKSNSLFEEVSTSENMIVDETSSLKEKMRGLLPAHLKESSFKNFSEFKNKYMKLSQFLGDIQLDNSKKLVEGVKESDQELTPVTINDVLEIVGEATESQQLDEITQVDHYYALSDEHVYIVELVYRDKQLVIATFNHYQEETFKELPVDQFKTEELKSQLPISLVTMEEKFGVPDGKIFYLGSNQNYCTWISFADNRTMVLQAKIQAEEVVDLMLME